MDGSSRLLSWFDHLKRDESYSSGQIWPAIHYSRILSIQDPLSSGHPWLDLSYQYLNHRLDERRAG